MWSKTVIKRVIKGEEKGIRRVSDKKGKTRV